LKDLLWNEINKEENRVNTFTHRNLEVQRPTQSGDHDKYEDEWDDEFDGEEWDDDDDDNDNAGGYMVDDIEYV
jgi:GTP-binding protein